MPMGLKWGNECVGGVECVVVYAWVGWVQNGVANAWAGCSELRDSVRRAVPAVVGYTSLRNAAFIVYFCTNTKASWLYLVEK